MHADQEDEEQVEHSLNLAPAKPAIDRVINADEKQVFHSALHTRSRSSSSNTPCKSCPINLFGYDPRSSAYISGSIISNFEFRISFEQEQFDHQYDQLDHNSRQLQNLTKYLRRID